MYFKPVYVKQDQANGLDLIHVALGIGDKNKCAGRN